MSSGDLLARLVARLDAADIPQHGRRFGRQHLHGVARTTQDIDIVSDPALEALGCSRQPHRSSFTLLSAKTARISTLPPRAST
jgi:hypothetical protein